MLGKPKVISFILVFIQTLNKWSTFLSPPFYMLLVSSTSAHVAKFFPCLFCSRHSAPPIHPKQLHSTPLSKVLYAIIWHFLVSAVAPVTWPASRGALAVHPASPDAAPKQGFQHPMRHEIYCLATVIFLFCFSKNGGLLCCLLSYLTKIQRAPCRTQPPHNSSPS